MTGFGLLGHAHELAERAASASTSTRRGCPRSPVRSRPHARASRRRATRNNRAYARVECSPDVVPELVELAYDPQTAGGLLISLPRDKGPALQAAFDQAGLMLARIGAVGDGAGVSLL